MTFDPKEARERVEWLRDRAKNSDCWCPNSKAADTITDALGEIERLRDGLKDVLSRHQVTHCHAAAEYALKGDSHE